MYAERTFLILTAILKTPLSMGKLMEAVQSTHGAIKKRLDDLAEDGFITVEKSEDFPFQVKITITDSGKDAYRKMKEISDLKV